jgi:hypothetical protein
VYELKVDRDQAIVDVSLDGTLREEDAQRFARELQEAIAGFGGREIRLKVDARTLRPVSPEVAETIRAAQALAVRSGVRRIAELVQGGVVALQLGRIAQESGVDRFLRRFVDERVARDWLRDGDAPRSAPAAPSSSPGRRTASRPFLDAAPTAAPPRVPVESLFAEAPGPSRRTTRPEAPAPVPPSSNPGLRPSPRPNTLPSDPFLQAPASEAPLSPRRTTWRDIPHAAPPLRIDVAPPDKEPGSKPKP